MIDRLNIRSGSSDWRGRILSNLAPTPFRIGDFVFPSVESPLQGIKFADPSTRQKVFVMNGLDALKAGRVITRTIKDDTNHFVYWQNERLSYNSLEHRLLIAMFIHEKVRQNPEVQQALLATAGTFIFHDTGGKESPHTSLPEKFYIEVLLAQRQLLKRLNKIAQA